MDFSKINSISAYTNSMKLKTKWKIKKENKDFQSQSKKSELQQRNDMFRAQYKQQQLNNETDETLQTINNKLNAGAELSYTEMKYLQTKDPQKYLMLKREEMEEKAFENELKSCKSKEDVEKLKCSAVSKAMSAIKSVKSNPNIPDGAKLAVAQEQLRKLDKMNRIIEKFVESGDYAKLPDKQEKIETPETNESAQKIQTKETEAKETEIKENETENTKIFEFKGTPVNKETKEIPVKTPETKKTEEENSNSDKQDKKNHYNKDKE